MITSIDYDTGEFYGYVIHPNGQKVKVIDCGTTESDTNAFVHDDGYPKYEWDETGEELSNDELNQVIQVDEDKSYLHEWLYENAEWE